MTKQKHSIADCLSTLEVVPEATKDAAAAVFDDCTNLEEEFKIIKKAYFKKVLECHPDKGGDEEQFRHVQTSFEVVRELYQKGRVKNGGFASYFTTNAKQQRDIPDWDDIFDTFASAETPSYEFYKEAAEEEVPGYRVELARSGRSKCVKCKLPNKKKTNESTSPTDTAASASTAIVATTSKRTTRSGRTIKQPAAPTALAKPTTPKHFIEKDSIRVGSLDDVAGSYGRWNHLPCWRVPSRIWSGLSQPDNKDIVLQDLLHMDEVLLTGLADLDADEQATFVEHVMDRSHWAKKYKYKKKKQATKKRPAATKQESDTDNKRAKKTSEPQGAPKEEDDENEENASTAIVASKERFVIPRPGVDGALAADDFEGKRFVLTGVFPEVGGGAGLNMGKDKVKQMIEDFGGRVTGSVSGKTDYLVVGKEPGASKVKKAHDRGLPLIDLRTLQSMLLGQTSFLEANEKAPPKIESFSAGYPNRMIAY